MNNKQVFAYFLKTEICIFLLSEIVHHIIIYNKIVVILGKNFSLQSIENLIKITYRYPMKHFL